MNASSEIKNYLIKKRIRILAVRDDLSLAALRVLAIINKKDCFTDEDLWFLELIEERYGTAQIES